MVKKQLPMTICLLLLLGIQSCTEKSASKSPVPHRKKLEKIITFLENRDFEQARSLFQEIERKARKDSLYFDIMYRLAIHSENINLRWRYSHQLLKAAAHHRFLRPRTGWIYTNLAGIEKEKGNLARAMKILENASRQPLDETSKRAVNSYLQPLKRLNTAAPRLKIEHWLNTGPISPEDMNGKIWVIDFWSPACTPCRYLFPRLQLLYNQYRNRDLIVLAVTPSSKRYSDDLHRKLKVTPQQELSLIEKFLKRHSISLPVGVVTDKTLFDDFGVMGYPTLFLINPQGIITDFEIGTAEFDGFIKKIEALRQNSIQISE